MITTRNKLLADLDRWQAQGWVTPEGARAIADDLASRRSTLGLGGVLAILAAILLGFGIMSFVAANWQHMPRIARLAVIGVAVWGQAGAAIWLRYKGLKGFSDAALVGTVAAYGAGIMLIAQMFHMDGHPPDAVLLWACGAVAVGLLTWSNPVLATALALFSVWSGMETFTLSSLIKPSVHWS
ncbi:MAG: DUF2157 domain-containing protein [Hyphomicrobiaceae bacterium]